MAKRFTARFPGTCVECRDFIDPGDEVTYDEHDTVVHAGCIETDDEPGEPDFFG